MRVHNKIQCCASVDGYHYNNFNAISTSAQLREQIQARCMLSNGKNYNDVYISAQLRTQTQDEILEY